MFVCITLHTVRLDRVALRWVFRASCLSQQEKVTCESVAQRGEEKLVDRNFPIRVLCKGRIVKEMRERLCALAREGAFFHWGHVGTPRGSALCVLLRKGERYYCSLSRGVRENEFARRKYFAEKKW